MTRIAISYVLASIVLLSQIGLPVHMHYCKGMLESVSVFFNQGCDDHNEVADLPVCCKKAESSSCSAEGSDCCDDRVSILIQDIVSSVPHFDKWDLTTPITFAISDPALDITSQQAPLAISEIESACGPPFYILHQALIFYA